MIIVRSTISGNTADEGGGIWACGGHNVVLSTISGNAAVTRGGGIASRCAGMGLSSSTVSSNTAGESGGGILNWGGAREGEPGSSGIIIENAIVANNSPQDCFHTDFIGEHTVLSRGGNLDSDDTCKLISTIIGFEDLPGVDPLLGPLADNGGLTQTHALLAGSPAIDANNIKCPPSPSHDQRFVTRPQGPACDIGAFELVQVIQVTIDIKPGKSPAAENRIELDDDGKIKVAILGSPEFDALQVDPASVQFGPAGAATISDKVRDTNKDGLPDLFLKFRIRDTGIACGDTEATLTGETFGGNPVLGTDALITVDCEDDSDSD